MKSPKTTRLVTINALTSKALSHFSTRLFHPPQDQQQEEQKENKTGLPDRLKAGIEKLSEISLDDVKVYYNSNKQAELSSFAYARGKGIYVASGQQKHLPHEYWHVVQQMKGRQNSATENNTNTKPMSAKVIQLVRPHRSDRIARYNQQFARIQRANRGARNRPVVRYNAGPPVNTYLVRTQLGTVLICPRGSYIRRENKFQYRGSRRADFAALGGTPRGCVWHHYHDFHPTGWNAGFGTMILLTIDQHRPGHIGGVQQWNQQAGNRPYG